MINQSKITMNAGISTPLLSYHLSDKNDLMNQLLEKTIENSSSFLFAMVQKESTPKEKLHTFIESNLACQCTHPSHNITLLEIIFNAKNNRKCTLF